MNRRLTDKSRPPYPRRQAGFMHQRPSFAGFIVSNMILPSRSVVRFYNKRGTAEQWIKEGKQATNWTRLSCHRFRANEVRLQLSVLAYPGQSLAAAGTAAANQELVADQPTAPADEDRRSTGQARPVLLAVVGRRASEPQAVRPDARAACGATCAGRLAPTARTSQRMRVTEGRRGRGVAKRPFAVVGTSQSGNIRRTEQSERGIEGGSSPKTGTPRPWIGYPARARTVKKEILAETNVGRRM